MSTSFMGLDSVELIIAWEVEFGILISNGEASSLRTVRDAIDLIEKKVLVPLNRGMCLSRSTFYELRRELLSIAAIDRNTFSPEANLNKIIPSDKQGAVYKLLRYHFQLDNFRPFAIGLQFVWGYFPSGYQTPKEIVRKLLSRREQGPRFQREEIETKMWLVIGEILGVDPKKYSLDARFIEDLGVD